MPEFLTSYGFWLVVALGVFWAVGAHNRLVRLRADIQAALHQLDAEWGGVIAAIGPLLEPPPSALMDSDTVDPRRALRAALHQVEAALSAVRSRALDAARMAALALACQTFRHAWDRARASGSGSATQAPSTANAGPDLAWPCAQGEAAWARSQVMLEAAERNLGAAVGAYNQAIRQFPAVLLAWLFGFQTARSLEA